MTSSTGMVYAIVEGVGVSNRRLTNLLRQFGDLDYIDIQRNEGTTTIAIQYHTDELLPALLNTTHSIDGFPLMVAKDALPNAVPMPPVLSDRTLSSFSTSSTSVVQISSLITADTPPTDKNNLSSFVSALLSGSLSAHKGKYVVINEGVVRFDHIYSRALDAAGTFSCETALTMRIPAFPDEDQTPCYEQRSALLYSVGTSRAAVAAPVMVDVRLQWPHEERALPVAWEGLYMYDTGASNTNLAGLIIDEIPLRRELKPRSYNQTRAIQWWTLRTNKFIHGLRNRKT